MSMGSRLGHHETLKLAQQILQHRKLRTEFFETAMLDPGPWDILLSLFVAESQGQTLTRQSLSKIGMLPGSVALRWINYLEQTHMIAASSGALSFHAICLTPKAKRVLVDYFAAVLSADLGGELAARPHC
jgi:hypothetical protein